MLQLEHGQQQQSKEELMAFTNDLCRLTSKAHAWGLHKDDLARLHSDIDAIKHIAATSSSSSTCTHTSTTSTTTNSSSDVAQLYRSMSLDDGLMALSPSSSFSSSPPSGLSSPVGSRSTSPSPPASGFLSATLATLSTDAVGQQTTTSGECGTAEVKVVGPQRRRNRGKNLPKDMKRACTICKAEKTSQWRSGADGRPTLCNACGLRYRHSMKQHRQYLARTQQAAPGAASPTTATADDGSKSFTSDELFARLRELQGQFTRQSQAQHLTQADSTDSMDESHHDHDDSSPSLCSSPSPLVAMPRRSSIYALLN